MDVKTLIEKNPNSLIPVIKKEIGYKFRQLSSDEDKEQTFWLGVVKALHTVDFDNSPLEYLILSGWNEVRNYNKANWSRDIARSCQNCGRSYGYRTKICPTCGYETKTFKRSHALVDIHQYQEDLDTQIEISTFVESLSGKLGYVARRWLVDRVDLYYDNHSKRLADEMGISPPMISKYKARIRKLFKEW